MSYKFLIPNTVSNILFTLCLFIAGTFPMWHDVMQVFITIINIY